MTRQMVQHMSFPMEEQRSFQQHSSNFTAILENGQVRIFGECVHACTLSKYKPPYTTFSGNIFNINDKNDWWLFLALVILHKLVHCFEPVHVDPQEDYLLYYSPVNARRREDTSLERVFEQGEILEI
jgi:hypothetical protein